MKKVILMIAACGLLLGACSKSEPGTGGKAGAVTFKVTAVNSIHTRADINSTSEEGPIPALGDVTVYAFAQNGSDYLYYGSYAIPLPGFIGEAGSNSGSTTLAGENLIDPGNYKFIAVGRVAAADYGILTATGTDPDTTPVSFDAFAATIAEANDATNVIFAGIAGEDTAGADDPIVITADKGANVTIPMTRKVAGIFVYLSDIPDQIGGVNVTSLVVRVSHASTSVLLHDGTGAPASQVYDVLTIPLTGAVNGVFPGQTVSGVSLVPGSYIGSSYVLPVVPETGEVEMTLVLKGGDTDLKTWNITGEEAGLPANTLMAIGIKNTTDGTNGADGKDDDTTTEDEAGTGSPNQDDTPASLSHSESITANISRNWDTVTNLELEEAPQTE